MHGLEVPHAFAGRGVEADQALGEQIVAAPMAAVVVVGRRTEGQVHVAERSSTLISDQTFVLPVYSAASPSHVSWPNSPGCGMAWNVHRRLPVRTS